MADKTLADWQTNAAQIQIDGRAFINGRRARYGGIAQLLSSNPRNGLWYDA